MQSESRLSPAALQAILSAHREALEGRGTVLRRSRHGAVTRVDCDGESLCVKQYGDRGNRRRLKDLLRRPRAERAWRAARRLKELGLATPEALALVQDGGARYLVMRFLPDGLPLDRLLQERLVAGSSREERAARRRMLRDLGRWLRGIHDAGVYHDDWSAKNILAAEHDGGFRFFLLDLESVAPHKGLNRRRRMKNLGQICDAPGSLTATDRMRCLIAYADGDRAFTRGSFPRGVLASARRRARRRTAAGGPTVAGVALADSGPVVAKPSLERRVEKTS